MSRLSLSQFIRESLPELAQEWERHAGSCMPAAESMSLEQLRDHVRELLTWIADDMESLQTAHEQREKSLGLQQRLTLKETVGEGHAALRVSSGFTLEQVVGEFRALRASVLRLRAATLPSITQVDIDEMTRFNEAVDQLLSESVGRYTQMVEAVLREANRNKDRFLAILSHELRNPLNAISVGLTSLSWGPDATADTRRIADMLARQTRHLKRLLDDLLDLSRISHDRITLDIESVDLRMCITDALAAVEQVMAVNHHAVNIDVPKEALTARVDPTRITQIVTNLLNNAAKYSPKSSRIELRLRRSEAGAEIAVRDSGRGITAEALKHIFESFYVQDCRDNREQQGLGIGLSISRRLAELHGGTLHAHSDGPGTGSEFCLTLPMREP